LAVKTELIEWGGEQEGEDSMSSWMEEKPESEGEDPPIPVRPPDSEEGDADEYWSLSLKINEVESKK